MRHLRCFLEVARLESLSAAAEAMHVSQPAMSKTIRELEEILGTKLFDRGGRRMALTYAGRILQQYAGGALGDLRRAQDLLRNSPRSKTRLAVGVLPTVGADFFPRAALAFRDRRPDCMLRVSTGPNWLLLSQLRTGDLDLVLGRMAAPDAMAGLSFRQLYSEPVVATVRPGHPLLARAPAAAEIGAYPLILPPSGAVISAAVRAYLQSQGLQTVEPAWENVSLAFGRKVVQLSDAIWFISHGVVIDELNAGLLKTLDLVTPLVAGPVGVSLRDTGASNPDLDELIAVVSEAAAALDAALDTGPSQ